MIQVINKEYRRFRVEVVLKGGCYGLNNCLTHDKDDPLVEFWDVECKQFVSRYYLSTLLESSNTSGLCLDGGVPEWHITAENKRDAVEYARLCCARWSAYTPC